MTQFLYIAQYEPPLLGPPPSCRPTASTCRRSKGTLIQSMDFLRCTLCEISFVSIPVLFCLTFVSVPARPEPKKASKVHVIGSLLNNFTELQEYSCLFSEPVHLKLVFKVICTKTFLIKRVILLIFKPQHSQEYWQQSAHMKKNNADHLKNPFWEIVALHLTSTLYKCTLYAYLLKIFIQRKNVVV